MLVHQIIKDSLRSNANVSLKTILKAINDELHLRRMLRTTSKREGAKEIPFSFQHLGLFLDNHPLGKELVEKGLI